MKNRSIRAIALEILNNWPKPNYAAVPYLQAMLEIDSIADPYMFETGEGVVIRFLGNASSWRGPTAKRIKTELKNILKGI